MPDQRHRCICPINRSGTLCEHITTSVDGARKTKQRTHFCTSDGDHPRFDDDSWIEVKSPVTLLGENVAVKKQRQNHQRVVHPFQLELRVKPERVDDAVLAYIPQSITNTDNGDYMAVLVENGRVVLRYDAGEGSQMLMSRESIVPDQWLDVKVERGDGKTQLIVGEESVEIRETHDTFTTAATTLSVGGSMYIGGVTAGVQLPANIDRSRSNFAGCIESPVRALFILINVNSFASDARQQSTGLTH